MNNEKITYMIEELKSHNLVKDHIPENLNDKIIFLKALMTISRPGALSKKYYDYEETFIEMLNQQKQVVLAEDVDDELLPGVYIFKGDITTIKAGAIVNAANEKMLGCFIPGHHCIDNAIHLGAGLKLRNACNVLMKEQGHDEPVGRAKITGGFNLPSDYVIHTVGPNMSMHSLSEEAVVLQLKSCYTSIMDLAISYGLKSVVFCSISTGVYGVPIELASKVALKTISEYLEKGCSMKVIVDVFSQEDYNVYKKVASEIR